MGHSLAILLLIGSLVMCGGSGAGSSSGGGSAGLGGVGKSAGNALGKSGTTGRSRGGSTGGTGGGGRRGGSSNLGGGAEPSKAATGALGKSTGATGAGSLGGPSEAGLSLNAPVATPDGVVSQPAAKARAASVAEAVRNAADRARATVSRTSGGFEGTLTSVEPRGGLTDEEGTLLGQQSSLDRSLTNQPSFRGFTDTSTMVSLSRKAHNPFNSSTLGKVGTVVGTVTGTPALGVLGEVLDSVINPETVAVRERYSNRPIVGKWSGGAYVKEPAQPKDHGEGAAKRTVAVQPKPNASTSTETTTTKASTTTSAKSRGRSSTIATSYLGVLGDPVLRKRTLWGVI